MLESHLNPQNRIQHKPIPGGAIALTSIHLVSVAQNTSNQIREKS
jgi:hypothetical protein